jgi:hypothetical protein
MDIQLKQISIRDLTKGYEDNSNTEEGIVGYDGKLDIRPKYQREFRYKPEQQKEVIKTILKGFPLNVMYWVENNEIKGEYELLDGQQRTISICEYVMGNYSIDNDGNPLYFHGLTNTEKEQILNYKIMIYFCKGTDKEKLDWFQTINIAGEKLTNQELRNAIYTGPWLSDAKRHFSKTGCQAYNLGSNYVKGAPIKQELLEKALKWISNDNIEDYMAKHQNDEDCNELWQYFQDVIGWVNKLFPTKRADMKSIEWGLLYNKYKNNTYNSNKLEKKYQELINDKEIEGKNTKGIYLYLITDEEKHLSLRTFDDKQKRIAFENQKGICIKCEKEFKIEEMEGDHIIAWSKGGETTQDNCQMLCKKCNGQKSDN